MGYHTAMVSGGSLDWALGEAGIPYSYGKWWQPRLQALGEAGIPYSYGKFSIFVVFIRNGERFYFAWLNEAEPKGKKNCPGLA